MLSQSAKNLYGCNTAIAYLFDFSHSLTNSSRFVTDYRLYTLPSTPAAMDRLSRGLDRIGADIASVWEGLEVAGFTTPSFVRAYIAELASTEVARQNLQKYWREYCRHRLSHAPLRFGGVTEPDESGLPYCSSLVKEICEVERQARQSPEGYRGPGEPTLRRFYEEPGDKFREALEQHRDYEVPNAAEDSEFRPGAVDSQIWRRTLAYALIDAMRSLGIPPDQRRIHATFPIFALGPVNDGFELILYLDRVRLLDYGALELKLGVFPEGKNIYGMMSKRENSLAYLEFESFVPYFGRYLHSRKSLDYKWNVLAIAQLASLIRERLLGTFNGAPV